MCADLQAQPDTLAQYVVRLSNSVHSRRLLLLIEEQKKEEEVRDNSTILKRYMKNFGWQNYNYFISYGLCNEAVESLPKELYLVYLDSCHLKSYFIQRFSKFILHSRPQDAVRRVEYLHAKKSRDDFIPN